MLADEWLWLVHLCNNAICIPLFSWVGKDPNGQLHKEPGHLIESFGWDNPLLMEFCWRRRSYSILVISRWNCCHNIRNQRHRLQNIHPLMVQNGAMTSDSVTGNCLLHGGNKSFEWARVRIFGGQGIGFITLCKCCTFGGNWWREQSPKTTGRYSLDEMYKSVVEKLRSEGVVLRNGRKVSKTSKPLYHSVANAHKNWSSNQAAWLEGEEGKEKAANKARKELSQMTEQCPKNILDPVSSRWQTTESNAKSLVKHLPSAYFFCVAIIQSKTSKATVPS